MVMRDGHAGEVADARGVPPPVPPRNTIGHRRLDFDHPTVTIAHDESPRLPRDVHGPGCDEAIEWRIESDRPNSRVSDYLIHTTIRAAAFSDIDFDLDRSGESRHAPFSVDRYGCLTDCLLTGEMPTAITRDGAEDGLNHSS